MLTISNTELENCIDYPALIEVLDQAFAKNYTTPLRHHHTYPSNDPTATFLLMPSWDNEKYTGVKLVTIHPGNPQQGLPSIQGRYLLFDIKNGTPLMQCDARLLTAKRTAATSALASRYLSSEVSKTLLAIGTGYLMPHLIEAHLAVRPIQEVSIWGRNMERAKKVLAFFQQKNIKTQVITSIEDKINTADIITTATMSATPLIYGDWLRSGQHVDLVGSYRKTDREADDEVIRRASVFVDQLEAATRESGDLCIPIEKGVLEIDAIKADLFEMCRAEQNYFRTSATEITLFKSVGHALEDLATASYIYEKIKKA